MPKKIDLSGQDFGKLYVIGRDYENPSKEAAFWQCRCTCGNLSSVNTSRLIKGITRSCGCGKGSVRRDPKKIEDWIRMYNEGYNTVQIGDIYGQSAGNVFDALKGKVIFRAKGNQGIDRLKQEELWVSQYKFGLSIVEIARKAKRSNVAIGNVLKEYGFNLIQNYSDRLKKKRSSTAETIFEIYKRGYCCKELGDIFDMSETEIHRLLSEFYKEQMRTRPQSARIAAKKGSAVTDDRGSVYISTDKENLKPISHKTKDLTWGQDDNAINRRVHIL